MLGQQMPSAAQWLAVTGRADGLMRAMTGTAELRERLADMTAQRDRACRQRLQPEAPPARVLWQMPANGSADIVHRLTAAIALLRWGRRPRRRAGGGLCFGEASDMILASIITCPKCGHQATEQMPEDACRFFYNCKGCGERLRPLPGHCCVFCSYGSVSWACGLCKHPPRHWLSHARCQRAKLTLPPVPCALSSTSIDTSHLDARRSARNSYQLRTETPS
jgi:hypothetical protein